MLATTYQNYIKTAGLFFLIITDLVVPGKLVYSDENRIQSGQSVDNPAGLSGKIDWAANIGRHDLLWKQAPLCKPESTEPMMRGAFLGNALLGALVYAEDVACDFPHHTLHIDVGRSDVADKGGKRTDGTEWWDKWGLKNKSTRLHTGGFSLLTRGLGIAGPMRLDLWNAASQTEFNIGKGAGKIIARTFVASKDPVIVAEVLYEGYEAAPGRRPRFVRRAMTFPGWPPPRNSITDGINVEIQPMLDGQEYAIAWCEVAEPGRLVLMVSLGVSPAVKAGSCGSADLRSAAQEAIESVAAARTAGLAELERRHREWWHEYYQASHIAVPDARIEGFHWIQQYKLGCTTRPMMPLPDETGPWSYAMGGPDDWAHCPGYPHIWFNLNTQLHYLPHLVSNHPGAGANLMDALIRYSTRILGEKPDPAAIAGIGGSSGYDLYGGENDVPEACHLMWLLHSCWLNSRYAADQHFREKWEKLLPLLAAAMNGFQMKLHEEKDGRLHMYNTQSPEYPSRSQVYKSSDMTDSNYELALCLWGARCLNTNLPNDPRAGKWRDIEKCLANYQVDDWGLRISKEVPFDQGHRHFSHLMMIWPLREWQWEDNTKHNIIASSLGTWLAVPPDFKFRTGFTWAVAALMAAHCQRGEWVTGHLDTYFDEFPRGTSRRFPNTMVREWGFCMETSMAASAAILDMLLQSHGGLLRVFPAIPAEWPDSQFFHLRGEGGFVVSARRESNRTIWVQVVSETGETILLNHGISDPVIILSGGMKAKNNGNNIILSGPPGGSAMVRAVNIDLPTLLPVEHTIRSNWHWGEP